MRTSFPVWGTTAHLLVTDPRCLPEARAALTAELAAIGDAGDRFRPDSELSRLNTAGGRAVRISVLFGVVLGEALRAAAATGGAVDPTVGDALIAAGYDKDLAEISLTGPALTIRRRPVPGWRTVELTSGNRIVRIPAGVRLDLGATAKAFAADRAAARAARSTGAGVLVSLGGDIAVSGPPPRGGGPSGWPKTTGPRPMRQGSASRSGPAAWRRRRRPCGGGGAARDG